MENDDAISNQQSDMLNWAAPIFEHYRFLWSTSVGIEFAKRGFDVNQANLAPLLKEFEKKVYEHILTVTVTPVFEAEKSTHLMLPEQIQELKTKLRLDLKQLMWCLIRQAQKIIEQSAASTFSSGSSASTAAATLHHEYM